MFFGGEVEWRKKPRFIVAERFFDESWKKWGEEKEEEEKEIEEEEKEVEEEEERREGADGFDERTADSYASRNNVP